MRMRASVVAADLGGELIGPDVALGGASIDSRTVTPGQLFVPLVAERDGHDFVAAAVDAGASAYLSSVGPIDGVGAPAIVVDDTTVGLRELGRHARDRIGCPVIAVTGSVGKTSVKDLIAAACGPMRTTHASERSFNNELGVPLTLANTPDQAELVVVEMGARGVGHIARLCEIARPTVGVVTRVALAHSELFGSIDIVAAAKAELVAALPVDGVAVLNADDDRVAAMASIAPGRVTTYGIEAGDLQAMSIAVDGLLRPSFLAVGPAGPVAVSLPVRGVHMVSNAMAALAAASAVGVDLWSAAEGLSQAEISPWRMEVTRAGNGLIVINDAYNANPTSMRAALDALNQVRAVERIAVLGAMAELGEEGPAEHRAVAAEAVDAGIRLIAVDAPEYGPDAIHVPDRTAAVSALGELGAEMAVLVKGSRVAGLERLAAELVETNS
ncbi:MAG: UDP-N-acetylmuramoyl-tripeptide--D-alanyl-D-alanine ligase [Acidimicrobiales bacterium]